MIWKWIWRSAEKTVDKISGSAIDDSGAQEVAVRTLAEALGAEIVGHAAAGANISDLTGEK